MKKLEKLILRRGISPLTENDEKQLKGGFTGVGTKSINPRASNQNCSSANTSWHCSNDNCSCTCSGGGY